jgi:NAD(P)-dependent dehydrogenase (short-subunit alcohol dehydrogenase family)
MGDRFNGKVAFVSGGGTGIGLACAAAIAADGGRVIIGGRREEVLREAVAAIGPNARYVVTDVSQDASVEAAFQGIREREGALNLAVNSAFSGAIGGVLNSTPEQFEYVLGATLTGAFRCMREEAKLMKAGGGGSIVNIGSIAGTHTHHWMTAYCVAKAGLNMLTRCAADDLGQYGIRVNAVAPGLVPTPGSSALTANEGTVAEYLARMPISRLGTVQDIASAVSFLLSNEASWVTGTVFAADGGHHLRQGPDLMPQFRTVLPEES